MLFCDAKNIVGFVAAKALDESEFEGIEPELRGTVVALNMDVWRLKSVGHVEEEAEAAFAQNRGHMFIVGFAAGITRLVEKRRTFHF